MNISFVLILIIKQKSGIPFLPLYTLYGSYNKIGPRNWFRTWWFKDD
jgi:hypothetical protein